MQNSTNTTQSARWALVTGASDGIGRATARQLARQGYNLVVAARRKDALDQLSAEIREETGREVRAIAVDLSDPMGPEDLHNRTADLSFSAIVLAAGYGTSGPFLDNNLAKELAMVDLNCRSVVECTHRFANRMRKNARGGTIVLFSSLVGFQGVPRAANYAASKGFIQVLAEGLRKEFEPFGIDVLAIAPGPVKSGFAEVAGMKMGKAGSPEEVAQAIIAKLGSSGTVRPGFLSKLLEFGLFTLPRRGRTAVMARVMASMTT